MSSSIGVNLRVSLFGQSHSSAIGVVLDGLPAGEKIDLDKIQAFLSRRAPGKTSFSTARREEDTPHIVSGLVTDTTCGAPLCAIIENKDARSTDYEALRDTPRPAHADYTAFVKYGRFHDIRGGGHFSGRLTAPLCFAGAVCAQILSRRDIEIGAHIASIGEFSDQPFDPVSVDAALLHKITAKSFPVLDDSIGEQMRRQIEQVRNEQDSLGGIVECCAVGVPAGIGRPMFDGIENRLAQILFGIPAVKGVEFGAGFSAARMRGSENNDAFYCDAAGKIATRTNHHGGSLGGISSGMPILVRVAFKPTPSIAKKQMSVSLGRRQNVPIEISGRHDPCVVPRAVPCVEAATAVCLLDLILTEPTKF